MPIILTLEKHEGPSKVLEFLVEAALSTNPVLIQMHLDGQL